MYSDQIAVAVDLIGKRYPDDVELVALPWAWAAQYGQMGDFFYVRTKQGNWKLVMEVSKIIHDIPKVLHVIGGKEAAGPAGQRVS